MEGLPRVLKIGNDFIYAYKYNGMFADGICLSSEKTNVFAGAYDSWLTGGCDVEYKGVMLKEWQEIIDNNELGEKIANSPEPVAEYLAQRGDKLREEKRQMETDSEPFTITEAESGGIDCIAEIERLGNVVAELNQFVEDLEGEHQFLAEENQDQRAVIKYLELKLAESEEPPRYV